MTNETKSQKGQYGSQCNRTICNTSPATWFNHSTRKFYCTDCSRMINHENRRDAWRLYGHELCTLGQPKPEQAVESAQKAGWTYTPGPWTVDPPQEKDMGMTEIVHGSDKFIAELPANTIEQRANRQLIVAAPELLEALQGMVDYYGDSRKLSDGEQYLLEVAQAAIGKAGYQ